MGVFRTTIFFVFAAWLGCGPAFAEKRVALVFGNSAYKNVPKLANPVSDAALLADMFKNAGFDTVTAKFDMDIAGMRKSLREFGEQARDADIAVIYYAGHGIELDGNNYLIPTDATLDTDAAVLDETVPLDRVLFAIEPAKHLRLVILDACRDNPFAKTMKRTIAARGIGRGLARVEPTGPNTLIAFAAKADSTASDGDSKNSPFAVALVEYLPRPGLDLRKAFGFVRDDVLKKTGYKQEPYVYGSLGGDDVPLVLPKPVLTGSQPGPQSEIRRDYELALQLDTRWAWVSFLKTYPTGFYADLAKGQIDKIAAEEARAAAAEKARLAEQEKARLLEEGAKKAEQEKAAAESKTAEDALIAAERAKQIEIERAAIAERSRVAAEQAAAERLAAEKAVAERKVAGKKAETAAVAKEAAETAADGSNAEKIASLAPKSDETKASSLPAELTKSVQLQLRRVGCLTAAADGDWNSSSQRSLTLYNRYAGTNFDVKLASVDALDSIKAKPSRVCPPICDHGFKADGDACKKIICRIGYSLGNDNTCERVSVQRTAKPAAQQKTTEPPRVAEIKPKGPSGQIICSLRIGGCRAVSSGCHANYGGSTESCK